MTLSYASELGLITIWNVALSPLRQVTLRPTTASIVRLLRSLTDQRPEPDGDGFRRNHDEEDDGCHQRNHGASTRVFLGGEVNPKQNRNHAKHLRPKDAGSETFAHLLGCRSRRDQQGGDQQSTDDLDHEDHNNRRHYGKGQPDGADRNALDTGGNGVNGGGEETPVHQPQQEQSNQADRTDPIQTHVVHELDVPVKEPLNVSRNPLAPLA